ncbi:AraC family transcriptional regulator [Flavobacterium sp. SUN052]|uniref:AraC family transcriptional regulator n=1 Tax=Flavobacterium sp. SUN052 TaxID=3002441 RepID=UPI00237D4F87|nr:AraC family transcriptional regulator [Flavobacterium sp. SUN052]MEC4004848.1 AraC family transcriptional regulator [Flavobacterium sp. SUN052]
MKSKRHLLLFLFLIQQSILGQNNRNEIKDSLIHKNYESLIQTTLNINKDTVKSKQYAEAWLLKAKAEHNWKQVTKAYHTILFIENKKERLKYADSLITAARKTKDIDLIGTAYLTKGIIYYSKNEHQKALDNYIIADEFISQTKNEYAIHKIKYTIAQTKYYLGFYEEAIALFKECREYYENENDRAYLNTIHSIGLCYNKTNNYELCSYYNNLGLVIGKECEDTDMENYFNHSEGINQFFKKNYELSISKLKEVIPSLQQNKDYRNETVANFYIGKNYWKLNQKEKAVTYFKLVDNSFSKHQYTRPDLRENYELLINFYRKQSKPDAELKYINKLLKVDSILNINYKYLSRKIVKEFDTKKLLKDKKNIEQSLKSSNRTNLAIIILLSSTIAIITFRHLRSRKRYKIKFEELMNEKGREQKKDKKTNDKKEELDINPDLVKNILQNLEKFEKNKRYLEKEMSLIKLAAYLKTNTKYTTKIIFKYRDKKTIEYISDLKIDYIIDQLKTESRFRNYTNKALAEEAGFGSTQNFTKAFNNRINMPPTYFIQELKKSFPI